MGSIYDGVRIMHKLPAYDSMILEERMAILLSLASISTEHLLPNILRGIVGNLDDFSWVVCQF